MRLKNVKLVFSWHEFYGFSFMFNKLNHVQIGVVLFWRQKSWCVTMTTALISRVLFWRHQSWCVPMATALISCGS